MINRKKDQEDMIVESFEYPNRRNAFITIQTLEEPYGPGSEPVVSVGCTLKGTTDDPSWKVHVPLSLAEDVAGAIQRRIRRNPPTSTPDASREVKKAGENESSE